MKFALIASACVVIFGIVWFRFVGAVLADVEAERTDLIADGRRCGLNPRA